MKPNGTITIISPDTTSLAPIQTSMVQTANSLLVTDQLSHRDAQLLLVQVAQIRADVVELFKDSKAAAHEAHKAICAAERRLLTPCDEARETITKKVFDYEAEVDRLQREADRAVAEAEERKRQRDSLSEMAPELAEALPPVKAPDFYVPSTATVEGVSSRANWKAQVTDLQALIGYVALHPECINLLQPNEQALNRIAKALEDKLNIPGVRAVNEPVMSVRRS